jgi:flagellar hook-basal body complex protein FliE
MDIMAMTSLSSIKPIQGPNASAQGDLVKLLRTDPGHMGLDGSTAPDAAAGPVSFENALMKAMDGVNANQMDASQLAQKMLTDPDSVDAHDLTIAQAEASMSLNLARTVLNRLVTGWKEIINAR